MSAVMRAVRFHAPLDIRVEELPVPTPGPGEVVMKVGAALTCGTDFKAYRRGHAVMLPTAPSPFGHEMAGTVAAVGKGVKIFKEGDRVVSANSAPCGKCWFCANGQNQLCDGLKLLNGGYAEFVLIPAHIVGANLWKLPKSLGFREAALSEPLACAVHGVEAAGVRKGETAAVIGAGPMAWLLIQALRARGARVLVVGRSRVNLETAKKAGAHEVFSIEDSAAWERLREASSGRGPDAVFEAVGLPETWERSVAAARKGGRVCLFAGCAPKTFVPVNAHRVHYEQLSLFGVFHHTPDYFEKALDLIAAKAVKTGVLIQGEIGLEAVPAFFAQNHERSIPKTAVIP